jgi:uncharacterized protein YoxC
MKMIKVHIALWIVLLAGGFLLGFVPEYLKNRELQKSLENPQKTIEALTLQVQMGELRDLAGLMLLELSRQNYGLARDYSTEYYNRIKDTINAVQDEGTKKSLEELASTRDSLSASLAAASPTSVTAAQPIVSKTFEVTKKTR